MRIKDYIIFGAIYACLSLLMEYILNIDDRWIYSMVFCLYGMTVAYLNPIDRETE